MHLVSQLFAPHRQCQANKDRYQHEYDVLYQQVAYGKGYRLTLAYQTGGIAHHQRTRKQRDNTA